MKIVIIAGSGTTSSIMSNLYAGNSILLGTKKCVGVHLSIPVFCILIVFVGMLGICLIWTKWILESERRLLRWYVANAIGDDEEFLDEHVLLRRSNVSKNAVFLG